MNKVLRLDCGVGGRVLAGLISGGQTVAVALQEALDADRVITGTVVATKAGTWGLGVYLQTSDNRCDDQLRAERGSSTNHPAPSTRP